MSSRLAAAIRAVDGGGISMNMAAVEFAVSETTLRRHLGNRKIGPRGRRTKFTKEEESAIVDLLHSCADMGVPLSKFHLRKVVLDLCEDKHMVESTFSYHWHNDFLKRHPRLSERITQAENRKKARQWTDELCTCYIAVVAQLKADGYLENPYGLWNLDESGFALGGRYDKVYATKGTKDVRSYFNGDDRSQLTVLACGNAAGLMLRPLILYDGVVELASRVEGTDNNFLVTTNKSGWMDNATFAAYIRDELIPAMPPGKNVIFLDGHSSHLYNISFLDVCAQSDRDIKILVFPAGQTGKLQPLDKCVFGGIKYNWRRHLAKLHLNTEGFDQLTRNTFPAHLNIMWPQLNLKETLQSGFMKTGLFPFNESVIGSTVPKVAQPAGPPVALNQNSLFDEEAILRGSLSRIGLPETDIDSTIGSIRRKVSGETAGYKIAEGMHKRLNQLVPQKKRKIKDTRLETEAGKLWCEATVRIALVERLNKTAAIVKKKFEKQQKTVKKTVRKVVKRAN